MALKPKVLFSMALILPIPGTAMALAIGMAGIGMLPTNIKIQP